MGKKLTRMSTKRAQFNFNLLFKKTKNKGRRNGRSKTEGKKKENENCKTAKQKRKKGETSKT
jgi:hypothetical protein